MKITRMLLAVYKRTLSPFIGNNCKFAPTCSVYACQAVEKHGLIAGGVMGLFRVLRCNPFSEGGRDPVPENYRGKIKWLV